MTAPTFVLLHSPLVGQLTWQPVADVLRGRGYPTVVPSLADGLRGAGPYYPALTRAVDRAIRACAATRIVLVPHSGAGVLVPSVVAETPAQVDAAFFVDAVLPRPGRSWADSLPAEHAQRLKALSMDGFLPPWNGWFPPETLAEIIPDPDLRARFIAEIPRLPLTYLEETAPDLGGPPRVRHAYLRLSDAYDDTADQAAEQGWPVLRHQGHHLSMLTDPEPLSDLLTEMLTYL